MIICKTQSKHPDCKITIAINKRLNFKYCMNVIFFPAKNLASNIDYTIFLYFDFSSNGILFLNDKIEISKIGFTNSNRKFAARIRGIYLM